MIEQAGNEIASAPNNVLFGGSLLSVFDVPPYNIANIPNIGWMLASQVQAADRGLESPDWGDAFIAMAALYILIQTRNTYRANTDLPGVTLGPDQQVAGRPKYQLEVGVGDTFAGELAADRSSYPPATMLEVQPLRRRAVGANDLEPTDHLIFSIDGQSAGHSAISRIYFTSISGNVGSDGHLRGTGQYHLTLYGHGLAVLHERLHDPATNTHSWTNRFSFDWLNGERPTTIHQVLVIYSDANKLPNGSYNGTCIMFRSANATGHAHWLPWKDRDTGNKDKIPTYLVPGANVNPVHPEKFRLDERQDMRSRWFVEHPLYYKKGKLITNTIDTRYILSNEEPLYVEWFGYRPAGTTVKIDCYDAETLTLLMPAGPEAHYTEYGYKGFNPASGRTPDTAAKKYTRTKYYCVITFETTDSRKSPALNKLRYFRYPVRARSESTPVQIRTIESISITGQDSDPTHESALVRCADLRGELTNLQTRAGMPIRVDVQYDPTNPSLVSTLFTGYVAQARRTICGGKHGKAFPVEVWSRYDVKCTGEWHRLLEAKTTQTWDFSKYSDKTGDGKGFAWKVTDIIRTLLEDAGYEDENVSVEDIDLRLFPSQDTNDLLRVEMLSEIYPVVAKLAMQYLGGWLEWDPNASAATETPWKMGMWRLRIPPKPEGTPKQFRNLAHFKTTPDLATTSGLRLRYSEKFQKVETGLDDQPIKTVWIRKNSYQSYVVPPEANAVWVTGVGINITPGVLAPSIKDNPITQVVHNYKAAKFLEDQPIAPDPTNPVYTNGRPVYIVVNDSSLWSQKAVDFYCRRLYDMACQAQKRITFVAPLLLIWNQKDTYQRQPRPLRFGDPVLFNGQQFIVANCNPDYSATNGGSRSMMALYELFNPTDLSDWKTAGSIS